MPTVGPAREPDRRQAVVPNSKRGRAQGEYQQPRAKHWPCEAGPGRLVQATAHLQVRAQSKDNRTLLVSRTRRSQPGRAEPDCALGRENATAPAVRRARYDCKQCPKCPKGPCARRRTCGSSGYGSSPLLQPAYGGQQAYPAVGPWRSAARWACPWAATRGRSPRPRQKPACVAPTDAARC